MVENQQDAAIAIIWLFPALTTVLVALRVYSRHLGRNFGWDDGLMMVAWVFAIAEAISTHQMTVWGWSGYHTWDIPEQTVEEQVTAAKWSYTLQIGYHLHMGAIRASIILFLFRLGDIRRRIQIALHTVFWFNILYTIGTVTANICTCMPVNYVYDKAAMDRVVDGEVVPGGECFNMHHFVLASCALSIFMDLIIIPIPTAMVWNLSMAKKTKVAVVIIMSMGWIATAVSAGRFAIYYYRWKPDFKDRKYDIGYVISIAESNVAMWAACVPALKRLVRYWMPYLFGHNSDDTYFTADRTPYSGPGSGKSNYNSKQSSGRNRRRTSDEDLYHMQDLNPDTDSQIAIMGQSRSYSFKVGVSAHQADSPPLGDHLRKSSLGD